ncbi:hypothetical protein PHYBLDRAFT_182792 [Phycomyces blakesleeanus NRRL 1555(-)]|uniref:Uncharacterized protein n=2 Tax=Phycomyces blakesleeanus TaxID=4837 RepID=A0A162PK33_PHYB8|nr:hypothetical protein PHYBLDRAFT_182792 [Phycomyces blakesleeanus NRRL 1555(-)]OAD69596.1 hypothetical protein PHYBLDRAFT_182792 [Phycomyces blakesleeanus NRRL 1555(-)]|eukprot:XP_018287636.1 hypothetical protein PHYBLDRAFT_182792 [Phycomyces blakesleeanus NRRL 1555(-)]
MLYTTKFDEKSLLSFIKWCNTKKVLYMNQEQERKVLKDQNGSKVRYRVLWTLKDEYLNGITLSITEHLPKYQAYIKNLKKNNFTVIGYARKSPGQEHQEVRVGLVQKMVNKLYDTLLVDKVFVTTSSRANDTITSRDTNGKNAQLTLLNQVHGNTQDLLEYICTSKNDCLVAIDFAGLSTNTSDLYDFIVAHGSIKKIIIDLSSSTGFMKYYNRDDIIDNPSILKDFDCRKPCYKRS